MSVSPDPYDAEEPDNKYPPCPIFCKDRIESWAAPPYVWFHRIVPIESIFTNQPSWSPDPKEDVKVDVRLPTAASRSPVDKMALLKTNGPD